MDCIVHRVTKSQTRLSDFHWEVRASQVAFVEKDLPVSAGDERDLGSVPGSGRSSDVGNANPLPYSCLENSMGRGAWRATVHGLAKSQTQLSNFHFSILTAGGLRMDQSDSKAQLEKVSPWGRLWSPTLS